MGLQLQDEASSVSSIAVDTSRTPDKQHFDTVVRRIEKAVLDDGCMRSVLDDEQIQFPFISRGCVGRYSKP